MEVLSPRALGRVLRTLIHRLGPGGHPNQAGNHPSQHLSQVHPVVLGWVISINWSVSAFQPPTDWGNTGT